MKKYLLLSLLILSLSFAKAQEAIPFKIKYKPNHAYQITGTTTFDVSTDLSGNKELASKLAAQGITEPIKANIKYTSVGNIITSSPAADNSFSFNMSTNPPVVSGTLNGQQIPLPTDQMAMKKFYGHVGPDGKLNLDSLSGQKLNDSIAGSLKKLMNNITGLINFPDNPLKVGESFTQEVPLNVPMGGMEMDIKIKITYKLISITGNNAFFDVDQGMDINMNIKNTMIGVTGKGAGKMIYDIKNNFPSALNSNLNLFITIKSDKFSVAGTAKIETANTYLVN